MLVHYLGWDDTSAYDKNVWAVEGIEFFDEFRHESFMTCCQCAHTNTVHICINGLLGHLARSLYGKRITHS